MVWLLKGLLWPYKQTINLPSVVKRPIIGSVRHKWVPLSSISSLNSNSLKGPDTHFCFYLCWLKSNPRSSIILSFPLHMSDNSWNHMSTRSLYKNPPSSGSMATGGQKSMEEVMQVPKKSWKLGTHWENNQGYKSGNKALNSTCKLLFSSHQLLLRLNVKVLFKNMEHIMLANWLSVLPVGIPYTLGDLVLTLPFTIKWTYQKHSLCTSSYQS